MARKLSSLDSYEGDLFIRRNADALQAIFADERVVGTAIIDSLFGGEVEIDRESYEDFDHSWNMQPATRWQHVDGLVVFG